MREALILGRIHVFAPDLGQAAAFYGDALGLRLVESHAGMQRFQGQGFDIDVFQCDAASSVDGYSSVAGVSVSFRVTDLEQAMLDLRERGVRVLHEVPNTASDGTRYAAFADPFGTVFELIEDGTVGR